MALVKGVPQCRLQHEHAVAMRKYALEVLLSIGQLPACNVSIVTHWTAENQRMEFKSGFVVMYAVDGFIPSSSTLTKNVFC